MADSSATVRWPSLRARLRKMISGTRREVGTVMLAPHPPAGTLSVRVAYEHAGKRKIASHTAKYTRGLLTGALVRTERAPQSADDVAQVASDLPGVTAVELTADAITAHNTFDQPERVEPAQFDGASLDGDRLKVALPAKSIVVLRLH